MPHGQSVADNHVRIVHKLVTFGAAGPASVELFQINGIVKIEHIYGIVETTLNADVDNVSLDVFPDGGPLVALATLVDSASAVKGSLFSKQGDVGDPLVLSSGATPFILENAAFNDPFIESIIGAEGDGTDTHIRMTYSGTGTDGAIDWHVEWKPKSDEGYVVAV